MRPEVGQPFDPLDGTPGVPVPMQVFDPEPDEPLGGWVAVEVWLDWLVWAEVVPPYTGAGGRVLVVGAEAAVAVFEELFPDAGVVAVEADWSDGGLVSAPLVVVVLPAPGNDWADWVPLAGGAGGAVVELVVVVVAFAGPDAKAAAGKRRTDALRPRPAKAIRALRREWFDKKLAFPL